MNYRVIVLLIYILFIKINNIYSQTAGATEADFSVSISGAPASVVQGATVTIDVTEGQSVDAWGNSDLVFTIPNNFIFQSATQIVGNAPVGTFTMPNVGQAGGTVRMNGVDGDGSNNTTIRVVLIAKATSTDATSYTFNAEVVLHSGITDPNMGNNTTSSSGSIMSPDISASINGTSTSITAGGAGQLNCVISNVGDAVTSTTVTFSINLPYEFTYINTNGSGSGWTVTPSGQILNIVYTPSIFFGASSSTLIININARSNGSSLGIDNPNYENITSTPMSLGTDKEIVTSNNNVSYPTIGVNKVSDLSISISSNATSFVPGREYFIDVTVFNSQITNGSVSDASSVRVRSDFPPNFILGTSEVIVASETVGVDAGSIVSVPGDNFFEIEEAVIPINGQVIYRFPIVLNANTSSQVSINANVSSDF